MTTKIVISPNNTKAIAFLQKLEDKKKELKKRVEASHIPQNLLTNIKVK